MLSRRETLIGLPTALLVSRIGWAEAAPQPTIFANELWHRPRVKAFGDTLRFFVVKKTVGQYVGAHRTVTTQHIDLRTRYTMELAYDGKPPDGFEQEIALIAAAEIAGDLEERRRGALIELVALDGRQMIDVTTFQPVLQFYIECNI